MTQLGRDTDIIALVGAGKGGHAILEALLRIPGIEVRYVFDPDPDAPGIALAQKNGIRCRTDGRLDELFADPDVDLIFEVTGKPEVFEALRESKHPNSSLLVAGGTRIIFHLLDAQRQAASALEEHQRTLERRIVERTEELERANRDLEQKILDYGKLTRELERVNDEKTRYLVHATHQLKAPFAAIQSYVDVILEGYTGEIPERTRDIIEKIRSRCEVLSDAIREMLVLANLRSIDRDGIEMSTVHLNEMIRQAVDLHAAIAHNRGIEIRFQPYDGADLVHCHPGQMLTLLSALLENAVIYSHDGGSVEVFVEAPRPNWLAASVRDQGIGIPARSLPRVFDEHYRSDGAVRHHEHGTGLGLAIAREVATLHHFHLDVESEEGRGSVFTLSVPLASEVLPLAPTSP
jgi:signal transduction histidine kinase